MTDNTPTFINISERAYQYIRSFTIQSIEDALVELITNSIDAYTVSGIQSDKKIYIDVYDNSRVIIRDYALGLTSDQMRQCFLQLGNFTSTNSSRGFFSRGAKDISAIGDVTFDAIINGSYSQCKLDTSAYGMLTIADSVATETIRKQLDIEEPKNGLQVTLDLLSNYRVTNYKQLYDTLCNLAVLRNIILNNTNILIFRYFESKIKIFEQNLSFIYPKSTNILSLKFNVPNYTEYYGKFVVNKTETPIPQPLTDRQMIFGFLIQDKSTVYEVNTIDSKYRWNPYMNYLYGYLSCNGIKELLIDYDTNGPSDRNPVPIIDPSRLTGINKNHPFIQALYSIVTVRLDLILRSLNTRLAAASISIEDIDDLLDELGKYGVNVIESNNITVNFTPSYDGVLAQAVNNDRSSYVTYEKSYQIIGQYTTQNIFTDTYVQNMIQTYIADNNTDTSSPSFYYVSNSSEIRLMENITEQVIASTTELTKIMTSDQIDALNVNPFIYKLSSDGKIEKLYIFSKGHIDQSDPANANVVMPMKQFTIQFVNDLNSTNRYAIDFTNGIVVNMNLNNELVKKYLANQGIDSLSSMLSMSDITSTQSLIFLRETMTQVFTDIIVNNDIITGKLILSGNSIDNFQNESQYWNIIFSKIEGSVDAIFQKYILMNINKKNNMVQDALGNFKLSISEYLVENYSSIANDFISKYSSDGIGIESILKNVITSILE